MQYQQVLLHLANQPSALFTSDQMSASLRILLLQWAWAILGSGFGIIIRNQTLLIGSVLAFSLFIEPTLSAASNRSQHLMYFTKWLPGPLNWACSWDAGAGNTNIKTAIGLPGTIALLTIFLYAGSIFWHRIIISPNAHLSDRNRREVKIMVKEPGI